MEVDHKGIRSDLTWGINLKMMPTIVIYRTFTLRVRVVGLLNRYLICFPFGFESNLFIKFCTVVVFHAMGQSFQLSFHCPFL